MGKNNKNILVIDDDDDFQELLCIYLGFYGYKVFRASNGLDAIGIINEKHIDMIITEWMLPMLDGLRFLQWLRQDVKKSLPVLILTAREKIPKNTIKKAGADAIIYKPVFGRVIIHNIETLLNTQS